MLVRAERQGEILVRGLHLPHESRQCPLKPHTYNRIKKSSMDSIWVEKRCICIQLICGDEELGEKVRNGFMDFDA
jgi:hypothetical protein